MRPDRAEREFQMLRARIESMLPAPFVLLVSSARDDDGAGACAAGLAESFAATGCRTALVGINPDDPAAAAAWQPRSLGDVSGDALDGYLVRDPATNVARLSLSAASVASAASRNEVSAMLCMLRGRFSATVVDAPPPGVSSLAVLIAHAADGVLLTVRQGRQFRNEDRETLHLLTQTEADVIGVVTVARRAIAAFARERRNLRRSAPAAGIGGFRDPFTSRIERTTFDVQPQKS